MTTMLVFSPFRSIYPLWNGALLASASLRLTGKYGCNLNSAGYRPRANKILQPTFNRLTFYDYFLLPPFFSIFLRSFASFVLTSTRKQESVKSSLNNLASRYLVAAVAQFPTKEARLVARDA